MDLARTEEADFDPPKTDMKGRVCKAKFPLLGPKCLVGEAKRRPNTQSTLGSPGPFGTAEGRETMTTTPETSLEVNYGP